MATIFRVLLGLVVVFIPTSAKALETNWFDGGMVYARLISPIEETSIHRVLNVALELNVAEGWHIYFRLPGEGAIPPTVNWGRGSNVKSVDMLWPFPKRFNDRGSQNLGYSGHVIIPLDVNVNIPARPVTIEMNMETSVCNEKTCVPQRIFLTLPVPAEDKTPMVNVSYRDMIEEARSKLPTESELPGLKINDIVVSPETVEVTVYSERGFADADIFIETKDRELTTLPIIYVDAREPTKAKVHIDSPSYSRDLRKILRSLEMTVTLTDGTDCIRKTFDFYNKQR
ncbi:MAG: hypothetical protein H6868_02250 [Rhodospirillales bacterium]|nr:hypothetical protein [Rhodospirillales bacterium]